MNLCKGTVVSALVSAVALLLAVAARADTTTVLEPQHVPPDATSGWQAGPCVADAPVKCAPDTPGQFFKTAGGHPPLAFVQFIVRHGTVVPGDIEPLLDPVNGRIPRTLRVDLPPGLSINPNATSEKCSLAEFEFAERGAISPKCKPATKIGETVITLVNEELGFLSMPVGKRFPEIPGLNRVDLFNLQPKAGQPALFGFVLAASFKVFLEPEIAWDSDFHEAFSIRGLPALGAVAVGGLPAPLAIHTARLLTAGTAGDGTLASNPTTCFNADEPQFQHIYSSWIRVESYEEPDPVFPAHTTPLESPLPAGVHPEGCANVPFDPSLEVDPGTTEVDSPASPRVAIKMRVEAPGRGGGPIAESHLRRAEVTLPEGMGLNPAAAAGLVACQNGEFGKGGSSITNSCPAGSMIGSAEIRTPVLDRPLRGAVYLGEPQSADPSSGEEFRVLVEAKSEAIGVAVRLIGQVKASPGTGQLTAVFDDQETSPLFGALPAGLPQVPVESVAITFDGPRQLLTSPPTCRPGVATGRLEPWARPGTQTLVSAGFRLSSGPAGGACPEAMDTRPFAPAYLAKSDSSRAATYSPFRIRIDRSEGEQELKRIDLSLPTGLIGKLAGIPYCPEAAIATAASRSGATEAQAPSCPAASLVGSTRTTAGSGGEPLALSGQVYLAGPYQGAPVSLVAITPALSGPFDLGTVVVRIALHVDPASAQIHAVSDVIPDVFGGVKLDLRSIEFRLARNRFTLNPTSCAAQATTGAIAGGGADPRDPGQFSAYPLRAPFQPLGCRLLGFAPQLVTRLAGGMRRQAYPSLTATLKTRAGDANVGQVELTLPHAFLVAQEHIGDVCNRTKLAEHACPSSSVYGEAEARSPLLDRPLSGPVYLVPSGHSLPDLVVDLRGQLEIQLHGVISAPHGKLKVGFDSVPDVPVDEFVLRMAGGKRGLIVNSTNLCRARPSGVLHIGGQNGAQLTNRRYRVGLTGCKKAHKHKKHRKRKKHVKKNKHRKHHKHRHRKHKKH